MSRAESIVRRLVRVTPIVALLLAASGCATTSIPPTYTEEELKSQCERAGSGVWHPDNLMGGFCEPLHS